MDGLSLQVPENGRGSSWTFSKQFSINTIVSVLSMTLFIGGPILVWGRAMEGRVLALEAIQVAKDKLDVSRDSDTREGRITMAARLDKMDDKLNTMQVQVGQLVVQLGLVSKSH